jgi:endonuclease/exonuclease/phosphatase family metal-dependent hydrolase
VGAAAVLVAAVVLGRAGQAEPGPASDGDGLRVVTWNVHYGFDEDWTFAPESMVRTLAREAPAVVALQEAIAGAPTAYGVDLPLWLGRRLGLEQHFSPTVNGLLGDAFLIRPGLGEVSARRLPAGGGDPKQLLQLRIPGPAPVTINALHLGVRAETRPAQIRAALAGIPTGPAVVLGDLNAGAASPVTTRLRAAGFADAFGGTGPPTFPAGRPRVRIDWIWTRGLTAAEPRVLDDASSDHRAVSATLHIDRDPDPEPARPAG